MNATSIGWTSFSSNPLKYRRKSDGQVVWGCVKVSKGCQFCYSEALALRWVRGKLYNAANMEELEPFLDEKELRSMLTYKPASGKRCFVGDMTDLMGEWVPDEMLDRLFAVFAIRADVTWQVLTKRAERMRQYLSREYGPNGYPGQNNWCEDAPRALCKLMAAAQKIRQEMYDDPYLPCYQWPLPNVHLGVSVEDQAHADERVPALLQTPAAVRFLSVEPMLAEVSVGGALMPECPQCGMHVDNRNGDENGRWCERCGRVGVAGIDWVIIGGESGSHFRPCDPAWVVALAGQCVAAGVPCFVKQASGPRPGMQGAIPDATWALKQFPACAAGATENANEP
jgi:protein gp37